ncbi:MAG TPA: hypothetical protein VIZ60_18135, partial [Rubrobacter sp.]
GFLGAYLQANPLEPAEVEALPALLAARPLKRAIGKYRSMIEETRISQRHVRKRPRRSPGCAGWKPTEGSCRRR